MRTAHEEFRGLAAALDAEGARLLSRSPSPVAAEAWHWLVHDQLLIAHVYERNDRGEVTRFQLFRAIEEALDPKQICAELESAFESRMKKLFGYLIERPAEPPSHLTCAQWSARNCPFLSNARRKRREDEVVNNELLVRESAGIAITRNPGVTLLWTTLNYELVSDGKGGGLLKIGEPMSIEFYANGKHATREEIDASITSGIPTLQCTAEADGPASVAELAEARRRFEALLPAWSGPQQELLPGMDDVKVHQHVT